MGWMEKNYFSKREFDKIIDELRLFFSNYYKSVRIERDDKKIDVFHDGRELYFFPGYMYSTPNREKSDVRFFVIEYAESVEEIENYLEDEGNQFWPEDYSSKDDMFKAMLREIEG